MRGVPVRSL